METGYKYPKTRWVVLLMLVFSTFSQGSILIGFAPILPVVSKDLGLDIGLVTGGLMGVFQLCVAISAFIGGVLIDKYGIGKVFFGSNIVMLISTFLVGFAGENFGLILLLRAIEGLAAGPVMSSVGCIAVTWFAQKERGLVFGASGASLMIGTTLGLILVPGVLQATGSWHVPFFFISILPFLGFVLTLIYLRLKKPAAECSSTGTTAAAGSNAKAFALAFKTPAFYGLVLGSALCFWAMQAFNDLTPGFFAADAPLGLGMGAVMAGGMMAFVQIGSLVASLVVGFLASRVLSQKLKMVAALSFILMAVFMFSVRFGFINSSPILPLWLFFTGVFTAAIAPATGVFATLSFPKEILGKINGLAMGIGIIGSVVGIAVGSTLLTITKSYMASIAVCGIVGIAGAVIIIALLNPPQIFQTKDQTTRVDSKK